MALFGPRVPRMLGGTRPSRKEALAHLEEAAELISQIGEFSEMSTLGRATSGPDYFGGQQRGGIFDGAMRPSSEALLQESRGWQAIAARPIVDRIQSLEPLVFVQRRVADGTVEEEQLDDHPLKLMLDRPTSVFTRLQLQRIIAYWIVQTGEAYLLKVTNGLGLPQETWPLSPKEMEPVTGRGEIIGFIHHGQGGDTHYDAQEIVRMWEPDPNSIHTGLGALATQAISYDTSKFIDQTARTHFERDATPKAVLVAKPDTELPQPEIRNRFAKEWRRRYDSRFGELRGLPAFIPPGFDLKTLDAFGGTTEMVEMLRHYRDQILMANGTPRSLVGDVVDANRAAAETNQFVFDKHTVKPKADLIADAYTHQLAHDFDEKLVVRFEDFVSGDKEFELKKEEQRLKSKVATINMVREAEGEDPVEWGDFPVGSLADTPYDGSAEEPDDDDDPEDDELAEAEEEEERSYRPLRKTPVQRARQRRRRSASRQGKARALDSLTVSFALEQLSAVSLTRVLAPRLLSAAVVFGEDVGVQTGITVAFDKTDPHVVNFVKTRAAESVKGINATTRTALRKQIRLAIENGETIAGATKRIQKLFKGMKKSRAVAIARTEVTAAGSFGAEEGMRQAAIPEKQWIWTPDDRIRDTHKPGDLSLGGQHVPIGDEFFSPLTGSTGLGPGRMNMAEESVNCRCALAAFFPEKPRSGRTEAGWTRVLQSLRGPEEEKTRRALVRAFSKQEAAVLRVLRSGATT